MSGPNATVALRNGLIVDGTGSPPVAGDVLVKNGLIAEVGKINGHADEEVDVKGAVIAPGFIDVHTHYDAQILWDPLLSPSSLHGYTTVLAGNCGFTLAPLSGRGEDIDYLVRMLSRVEGMPLDSLRAGVKASWTSFGDYLNTLENKAAINVGFLVGHSAIRVAVMGSRAVGEKATPAEIEAMKNLLRRSLTEGGMGFSTTISPGHIDNEGQPVPSRWATREELLGLCAVLREYPGTWVEMVPGVLDFTDETYQIMTDMALAAGRPLNWNVYYISADKKQGFESQLYATDYARARGARVFGLVQSAPSKTRLNLRSGMILEMMQAWQDVFVLPHVEKLKAFADPDVRRKLADAPKTAPNGPKWIFRDWGNLTIEEAFLPHNKKWEGKNLAEIGAALGKQPLDALLDMSIEEDLQTSFAPAGAGGDDASWRMRAQAWTDNERCLLGGSDAGAHLDMLDSFTLPTRLLSDGVRERKLIKLEEAVRQLTSVPADLFGLKGRGRIAPGMNADLVVFDPATVGAGPITTRYDLPAGGMRLYSEAVGISRVMVNGQTVVRQNVPTGNRSGAILRSGRDTHTVAA
jgi:N-acyl-D-aspartate/D-glutamate deacylase